MYNLDFLDDMLKDKEDKILEQPFLLSNFEDNLWIMDLDLNKKFKIDFNITLYDGSKLIENKKLLNTLKYWILYVNYPENGISFSSKKIRRHIYEIINLFDLMNDLEIINIEKEGFTYLNYDHIKEILNKISSINSKSESIYSLSIKLGDYFKNNLKKEALKYNDLKDFYIDSEDFKRMNISENDMNLFQNWIFKNEVDYSSYTSTLYKISKDIFKNTLTKNAWIPNKYPKSLKVKQKQYYNEITEFSSFYVDNEKTNLNEVCTISYKNSILKLLKMKSKKIEIFKPINIDINSIKNINSKYKENKRFKTVPSETIFYSIKKAIEFHIEYGEDILNSYSNIIDYMRNNNMKKLGVRNELWLKDCFTEKIKKLGVIQWYYPEKNNRFNEIRNNKSFYALLKIYYGMIQTVVGAIMARRQSELISLKNNECLDLINKKIIFNQSKSSKNLFGVRNTLSLPIDELAIDMILNLQKINNLVNKKSPLFLPCMYNNPLKKNENLKHNIYNSSLDIFFDYIQIKKINNKRLYFRQHQLRRFFAMTFFWNNKGNMDTLRWFLGHTDVQHLYHYITENTKGSVLKNVKTQYIIENEKDNSKLVNLIKSEYNTEIFEIIEEEDLEFYIEDLIDNNKIDIEPEFFSNDEDKKYEIILKIKEEANE